MARQAYTFRTKEEPQIRSDSVLYAIYCCKESKTNMYWRGVMLVSGAVTSGDIIPILGVPAAKIKPIARGINSEANSCKKFPHVEINQLKPSRQRKWICNFIFRTKIELPWPHPMLTYAIYGPSQDNGGCFIGIAQWTHLWHLDYIQDTLGPEIEIIPIKRGQRIGTMVAAIKSTQYKEFGTYPFGRS